VSRHWGAPRIAYELAADWAERVDGLAVGDGGAHGQFFMRSDVPLIGKEWSDLRTVERHDVLAALAAQARSAVWELRKNYGTTDDSPVIINVGYYTDRICERAKATLRALMDPTATAPWTMPECTHCTDLLATAMIDIQVRAIGATGVTDPVSVLRMLLDHLELPSQREAQT
jgi:hypothetical protein